VKKYAQNVTHFSSLEMEALTIILCPNL